MADAASARGLVANPVPATLGRPSASRHRAFVRITHWLTALCFFSLLVTGVEILISHPRFYWGETGNVNMTPLFSLPIPSSRALVPTGYSYVLPDQNGWSRALHFQSAWLLAFTGFAYLIAGLLTRHFRRNLLPGANELSWRALSSVIADHLHLHTRDDAAYNPLQKVTYLFVIAVLFPLVMWTGLAMSPAFVSIAPATASLVGGQQSARTIHFFVTIALVVFLLVHVAMIFLAGFKSRMRAMITGGKS